MRKRIDYDKVKELYDKGLNDPEIAREMNIHQKSVFLWRKRKKLVTKYKCFAKRINRKKIKPLFVALWNKNVTYKGLYKRLNISSVTIANLVREFNLKGRSGGKKTQEYYRKMSKKSLWFFKVKKLSFEDIGKELEVSTDKARYYVGKALTEECRKDKECVYKALLPEYEEQ